MEDGDRSVPPGAGPYPAELESEERLRDGTPVRLRPIRPEDAGALTSFHDHLSSQTVYRRFFSAHPHLTGAEVERFTNVDYVDRLAFVVEIGAGLIGVGRYERNPGTAEAEVAFVVADDHQHRGVGTLLLERLADVAWNNGIGEFVAQTLADNREMVGVLVASGFPVRTSSEHGTVSARFSIAPGDDYRRARDARHRTSEGSVPPPDRGRGHAGRADEA